MIFAKKVVYFLFGININILFFSVTLSAQNSNLNNSNFSQTYSKFYNQEKALDDDQNISIKNNLNKNYSIWEKESITPFTELILSWNAFRPKKGQYSFWVSVHHNYWSKWYKMAEWGADN